jgi:hypothetical protein
VISSTSANMCVFCELSVLACAAVELLLQRSSVLVIGAAAAACST